MKLYEKYLLEALHSNYLMQTTQHHSIHIAETTEFKRALHSNRHIKEASVSNFLT